MRNVLSRSGIQWLLLPHFLCFEDLLGAGHFFIITISIAPSPFSHSIPTICYYPRSHPFLLSALHLLLCLLAFGWPHFSCNYSRQLLSWTMQWACIRDGSGSSGGRCLGDLPNSFLSNRTLTDFPQHSHNPPTPDSTHVCFQHFIFSSASSHSGGLTFASQ